MVRKPTRAPVALLAVGGVSAALVASMSLGTAMAAVPAAGGNAACPAQPGITPTSIKFATIMSQTGANAANFNGFAEAVQLRLAQENAKGGVNGRKLSTVVIDDKSNGTDQVTAVNKALQQENAFAVFQETTQDTMMPILKASNVPVIGIANGTSSSTDMNAFVATGQSSPTVTTTAAAQRIKDAGGTKTATITFPVPQAIIAANAWKAANAVVGVPEVLRVADAPFGAYDATSTALKIKQSGADSAFLILLVDGGVSVMNAMKQQGVTIKAPYMAGLSDPDLIAKAGPALNGVIGSTYGTVPGTATWIPGVRTYVNGMKAAGLNPYGASPPLGYVSADTFIKGLKTLGACPTRQGLLDALHKAKSFDGGGLLPAPISYRPGVLPTGTPPNCQWFITVVDGKMVADKKATCGQLIDINTGKVVG